MKKEDIIEEMITINHYLKEAILMENKLAIIKNKILLNNLLDILLLEEKIIENI